MELLGKFEAALRAEIDVDQYHLRPQLFGAPERLSAGRCHADNRDPLVLEQATRGFEETRVVIDDQAAHRVTFSMISDLQAGQWSASLLTGRSPRKGVAQRCFGEATRRDRGHAGQTMPLLLAGKDRLATRRRPHSRRAAPRGLMTPPAHGRPAPELRLSTVVQ